MKKTSLDELASKYRLPDYKSLHAKVMELIENRKIKPVKASGINGKSPALYREYWITEEKQDVSQYCDELNYDISPAIMTDYYKSHIDRYIQDRQWVLLLNDYIKNCGGRFMTLMSENERSFDIWHREKFLKQEQGRKILKRCGIDAEALNFYRTTEPLAYYCATRRTPQKLLIVENKDTFYSMRKCLLEGSDGICGEEIGTLIYGAGKGIISAFADFAISGEPYMMEPGNKIYYFGDMDYEGIGIYENFAAAYKDRYNIMSVSEASGSENPTLAGLSICRAANEILLFKAAYEKMLDKAERVGISNMPLTKEGQNRKIGKLFLSNFSRIQQEKIMEILESDRYIPQEILNVEDIGS